MAVRCLLRATTPEPNQTKPKQMKHINKTTATSEETQHAASEVIAAFVLAMPVAAIPDSVTGEQFRQVVRTCRAMKGAITEETLRKLTGRVIIADNVLDADAAREFLADRYTARKQAQQ